MRKVADIDLTALEGDLAFLEGASLSGLRAFWRERWGFAPRLRSVALLRHIIAWRLQSALFGGLDDETLALLRQNSTPRAPRPPPGTRLTREFRGELHEVKVEEHAFIYAGREYGSLSEVARTITGTRWNGPRFFGLRDWADRP